MYTRYQLLLKYLGYRIRSSNGKGHGVHSPFIFEFITRILNDRRSMAEYDLIEGLRAELLQDRSVARVEDLGAGSAHARSAERTVASLARNAAKPAKYGQLLFRMVRAWQPQQVLELGTSLGLTTSYLAAAAPTAQVLTLEGAEEVAVVAERNFRKLRYENIHLIRGNFDDTLQEALKRMPSVDFVFIDGNHRLQPTMAYFEWLLTRVGATSVLVFDDIHWSAEMEEAWARIQQHPSVRCTVDLFFIGLVFFRHEFKEKQHFAIRF